MSPYSPPFPQQGSPEEAPHREDTSSGAPGERSAQRQADIPSEEGRQCTQPTQAWTPQPRVHVWAHSEMETLSFPTHIHMPGQMHQGLHGWTHQDLNMHTSGPTPVSLGGGSFATHMESRSS